MSLYDLGISVSSHIKKTVEQYKKSKYSVFPDYLRQSPKWMFLALNLETP